MEIQQTTVRLGVVTSLRRGFRRSCKTSGYIRRDEILIVHESKDVRIKMMPRNHCVFSMCFADLNHRHLLCLSFKPYIGRHQACYNDQWYQNHANGVHQAAIKGIKKTSEVDFFQINK